MQFNEKTYQSLVVLAENYRVAKPPRIKPCLQCLLSVFNLNPPPHVQIRTHIQVGSLLLRHTENKQLSETHLAAAMTLSKENGNYLTYFESVSLLSTVLCQMSKQNQAKPILQEGITSSQQNPYWHARLLLQLAHIHHEEGDHTSTLQLLDVGAELANTQGSDYLKILFLLSKGMVLLVQQKLEDVNQVLSMCGQLIDGIKNATPMQIESHKVYFLTLQVAHLLQGGQVKSVKSSLKQLQQSIQEITSLPASACSLLPQDSTSEMLEPHEVDEMMKQVVAVDAFSWLPRDHMCILVYLVTVTYSLLAGYLDKAQKYTEKALKLIRKLKLTDSSPLLVRLELMFLEQMSQCHLIMCDKKAALQKIMEGCRLCVTYPDDRSIVRHTTQMHTLLGMYCMSMNYMDDAEKHLQIATKNSIGHEQLATNMLNLAMVHMHNYQLNNGRISQAKHQELVHILNQISPDTVALKSRNLKAASYFVKGMFAFFQSIHNDAKRFLRETLKMANAQDLNRLTACALVLLGHIYLTVGNNQESVNMVLPAMQLANKIPDNCVKLWASALLRDLYRLCGDEEHFNEYKKMYEKLASRLLSEQYTASESSQHELIKWFTDELPPVKALDETETQCEDQEAVAEPMDTTADLNKILSIDESGTSGLGVEKPIQNIPTPQNSGVSSGLSNQSSNMAHESFVPQNVVNNRTPNFYPQKEVANPHTSHKMDMGTHQKYPTHQQQQILHPTQVLQNPFVSNLDMGSQPGLIQGKSYHNPSDLQMVNSHDRMQSQNSILNQLSQTVHGALSQAQPPLMKPEQKLLTPDPGGYLQGVQPHGLDYANAIQRQQFQMLQQQMQQAAGGMHTMYHPDHSSLYPLGQGYQAPNDPQLANRQQQQAWSSNRTNFHNIQNSGYNWR